MYFCKIQKESPEANIAFDEAMIEWADAHWTSESSIDGPRSLLPSSDAPPTPVEVLRLWQFDRPTIVLGRASRFREEVLIDRCAQDGIPILRRASGGSTIIAGPGCLMYSLLLSYAERPGWRGLDIAHQQVMQRMKCGIENALRDYPIQGESHESAKSANQIEISGTCDLTVNNLKFSGNAVRCKKNYMLYHGTIMVDMPLHWIPLYLKEPPRQPDYRNRREHRDFVTNLVSGNKISSDLPGMITDSLCRHLIEQWNAYQSWDIFPGTSNLAGIFADLMDKRYSRSDWHFER